MNKSLESESTEYLINSAQMLKNDKEFKNTFLRVITELKKRNVSLDFLSA